MLQAENSNEHICERVESKKESGFNSLFPQVPNNEANAFFVRNLQTILSALALCRTSKNY